MRLDNCSKKHISKHFLKHHRIWKVLGKMLGKSASLKLKHQVWIFRNTWCSNGANEVDIYNFLTLVTIDTNINQFIKVYHILDKMQYKITKIFKVMKKTILWGWSYLFFGKWDLKKDFGDVIHRLKWLFRCM